MINKITTEIKQLKQNYYNIVDSINPIDFAIQLTVFFIAFHFSSVVDGWKGVPILAFGSIGIFF